MKRLISLLILCTIMLSGCQSTAMMNQDKGIPISGLDNSNPYEELLMGSTETKTPFLPIANADFQTSTALNSKSNDDEEINNINQTASTEENGIIENTGTPIIQTNSMISSNGTPGITGTASLAPTAPETHSTRTSTPTGKYIELTGVSDRRIGLASVVWSIHGDFKYGFSVVYSETNPKPIYPDDEHGNGITTRTPISISTNISGIPGHTYYVRVCEHTEEEDGSNLCKFYSNTIIFTFNDGTATPTKTISNNLIMILTIESVGEGVSRVNWWTEQNYPKGFEIIYTKRGTDPRVPYYPSEHANNSDRSILVYGDPGSEYAIRICGFIGNTCDDYSAVRKYTFPINTPTSTHTPIPPTVTDVPPSDTPIPTLTYTETQVVLEPTETPTQESVE
ncbi:MAG: hypothetical protein JEZ00_12715 [Anaerolineaceae bacterium]|nr:hypothetical protein [Anaerolineaceae bacterium]